jgi:hypothetical protein
MKTITKGVLSAGLVLALLMPAVAAQAAGGHKGQSADKSDNDKPKADEKAYAQALSVVPNKSYDPWGVVRQTASH